MQVTDAVKVLYALRKDEESVSGQVFFTLAIVDMKPFHVVMYVTLGCYFGMILPYFGMKIYYYLLF